MGLENWIGVAVFVTWVAPMAWILPRLGVPA